MAAILVKIYRFPPGSIHATGADALGAALAARLAADGVVNTKLLAFECETIRGEIVYTVMHIA